MRDFDQIYLSWRQGLSHGRHIVGILKKDIEGKFTFQYFKDAVENAKHEGFCPYTEFPDVNKTYNGNVLDIFSQRLTKSERIDIQSFYDFWEVEPELKDDKFYLLGHTQGWIPTDNFEFLADYKSVEGIHFLTEIAGLSNYKLHPGSVNKGDVLRFELDKKNRYDAEAVKVFKDNQEIGYIKKIHSKVFHKPDAENLKLTVKAVEKNGVIKRIFVKVSK